MVKQLEAPGSDPKWASLQQDPAIRGHSGEHERWLGSDARLFQGFTRGPHPCGGFRFTHSYLRRRFVTQKFGEREFVRPQQFQPGSSGALAHDLQIAAHAHPLRERPSASLRSS